MKIGMHMEILEWQPFAPGQQPLADFFFRVSMTEQLSGMVQKLAYWILGSVFPRVRH